MYLNDFYEYFVKLEILEKKKLVKNILEEF